MPSFVLASIFPNISRVLRSQALFHNRAVSLMCNSMVSTISSVHCRFSKFLFFNRFVVSLKPTLKKKKNRKILHLLIKASFFLPSRQKNFFLFTFGLSLCFVDNHFEQKMRPFFTSHCYVPSSLMWIFHETPTRRAWTSFARQLKTAWDKLPFKIEIGCLL